MAKDVWYIDAIFQYFDSIYLFIKNVSWMLLQRGTFAKPSTERKKKFFKTSHVGDIVQQKNWHIIDLNGYLSGICMHAINQKLHT